MRILHVTDTLSAATGGPAMAAVEMASAMARRGHEVAIYATDHGGVTVSLDKAHAAGLDIRVFPTEMPRFWKRSPAMADALETAVRSADMVHLHSLYSYHHWVVGKACQRFEVPYVVRPGGLLDPFDYGRWRPLKSMIELWFQNRLLNSASAIHYTTEEEKRRSEPNAQAAPGTVVPLGIYPSDFAELPPQGHFRERHPEIGKRRIVLFLGRLTRGKGVDILVPAFDKAVRSGLDLHLVIAGPDDGMEGKARRLVAEAGLGDRTTFTGLLTNSDKLAAFADAEIFALPAHSENFGLTIVEAMACGLPVLVSDRVNIWPDIEADGAGVVCGCDASSIGITLADLLRNPNRLSQMGAAGRLAASRRYDWNKVAGELEAMYRTAIEQHDSASAETASEEAASDATPYFDMRQDKVAAGASD